MFFFKICAASNEARRLLTESFLFFKKGLYKVKLSGQHLNLKFGRHPIEHTVKTNFITI